MITESQGMRYSFFSSSMIHGTLCSLCQKKSSLSKQEEKQKREKVRVCIIDQTKRQAGRQAGSLLDGQSNFSTMLCDAHAQFWATRKLQQQPQQTQQQQQQRTIRTQWQQQQKIIAKFKNQYIFTYTSRSTEHVAPRTPRRITALIYI